jgi:single-strand DNA-binding protein
MSSIQNKVSLIGRLGQEPTTKTVGDAGHKVLSISIAVEDGHSNKDGTYTNATGWHKLQMWNGRAEYFCSKYKKGQLIAIEGKLKNDTYTKDGEKRFFTYVEVYDFMAIDKSDLDEQKDVVEEKSTKKAAK